MALAVSGEFVIFGPCRARCEWSGLTAECGVCAPREREDIFVDDIDRQDFLKMLVEACQKTGWQVHG